MKTRIALFIVLAAALALFINYSSDAKEAGGSVVHVYGPANCSVSLCGPVDFAGNTGSSGHCVFSSVPDGSYCVQVHCPGGGSESFIITTPGTYGYTPTGVFSCSECEDK